jgi:demethylmenaquinone methyltransferase/2-methoxy-6-polyprenyl-1,4-benzoquinol methylase
MVETPNVKDPARIQSMFAKVAPKYDDANTILSAGIHHLWRKKIVRWAQVKPEDQILDCATGTGDLALEFKACFPSTTVTGTDFCQEMLDHAPLKAKNKGLEAKFLWADATNLPFPDQTFNVVTISFGIRNVVNPVKALSEMHRVLKPGGRLLVLEFGQPEIPVFKGLYKFYSEKVLPIIGGWVSGQKEAYQYLQESSAEFPCGRKFIALLNQAGSFEKTEYRTLTGGIAYMYRAERA